MKLLAFLLLPAALIYLAFQVVPGATCLILAILEVASAYPLCLALRASLRPMIGPGGGEGYVAMITIGLSIVWLIIAAVLYRTRPWRKAK